MITYNVLIYNENPVENRKISFLCQQLGMTPHMAENYHRANTIIKDLYLELALVDISLETIDLHEDSKVIALANLSPTINIGCLQYTPLGLVQKNHR